MQVGAAFSDYVNELKKSVHPGGFRPFGKVSIASLVSVAVTDTATGVQSFVGDGRFSPYLHQLLKQSLTRIFLQEWVHRNMK